MCGIVAMYSSREPISTDSLERATARLNHRGPDGQKTWVSNDRRIGLVHARLSIIDLATGDQPIASEDERLRIVVNGEFYDFERIQRELEGEGHRLKTRSDSEIALHLYEDLGTACLSQLRGEFAFALWDGRNDTLFAARDRFGIKPLFYAHHRGTLYVGSEIKALLAAGVPGRWDHATFLQANHILVTPEDRTLFDGILHRLGSCVDGSPERVQFAREVQALSGIAIYFRACARSSARNVVDGWSAWPIQPMSVGKPNRSGTTKVTAQKRRSRPGTDWRLAGQGPGTACLPSRSASTRRKL